MTKELTVLEGRLDRLSSGTRIESDRDFVRALEKLIDGESEKSADEVDAGLVSEALDAVLCFEGKDGEELSRRAASKRQAFLASRKAYRRGSQTITAPAQTGERGSAPRTSPRRLSRRAIIPLAAALVIVMSLTFVAIGGGFGLLGISNHEWKGISPETKAVYGDREIQKSYAARGYDDLTALLSDEGISGVTLPKGVTVEEPLVVEYADRREITAKLTDGGGAHALMEIDAPSPYEINGDTTKIAGFDVLVSSYDGSWQGEWTKDGVWYMVKTDGESALYSFIAAFAED